MKLILRDIIGNEVQFDSSPADISAISKVAKRHVISPTETHSYSVEKNTIFVDDTMKVLHDYLVSTRDSKNCRNP